MSEADAAFEDFSPLIFTDAAANKVKALIEEEDNDSLMLRVFVTGRRMFRFSVWLYV